MPTRAARMTPCSLFLACVKEIIRNLRISNIPAPISSRLDSVFPRPFLPCRYTHHDLIEEHVAAGLPRREDFNDAQALNKRRQCVSPQAR